MSIFPGPLAPTVKCGEIKKTSLGIVITAPSSGLVDMYGVSCPLCGVDREIDKNSTGSDTKHSISGLIPFRDYNYEVKSIRRDYNSGLEEVSIVTSGSCKTNNGRKYRPMLYNGESNISSNMYVIISELSSPFKIILLFTCSIVAIIFQLPGQ